MTNVKQAATRIMQLPFCGFCYSEAGARLNYEIGQYFDKEGDGGEHVPEEFYTSFDWGDIRRAYCEAYVKAFEAWLADEHGTEVGLKFKRLVPPRGYNFATDELDVTISLYDVRKLWRKVDKDVLRSTIKERHSSREGLISFYPHEYDEFCAEALPAWDHNKLQTLLVAVIGGKEPFEHQLMEYMGADEAVSAAVYAAISGWESAQAEKAG